MLLTTSAAAYAAQLPNKNDAAQPAFTVSPGDLDVDIRLDSYELTSDRLLADFTAVSVMGHQFRTGAIKRIPLEAHALAKNTPDEHGFITHKE